MHTDVALPCDMTRSTGSPPTAPPLRSRIAAGAAFILAVATLALLAAFTVGNLLYVLAAVVSGVIAISMLWVAATDQRFRWWAAARGCNFRRRRHRQPGRSRR